MKTRKQYEAPQTEAFETGLAGAMIAASAREITAPDGDEQQLENGVWDEE